MSLLSILARNQHILCSFSHFWILIKILCNYIVRTKHSRSNHLRPAYTIDINHQNNKINRKLVFWSFHILLWKIICVCNVIFRSISRQVPRSPHLLFKIVNGSRIISQSNIRKQYEFHLTTNIHRKIKF